MFLRNKVIAAMSSGIMVLSASAYADERDGEQEGGGFQVMLGGFYSASSELYLDAGKDTSFFPMIHLQYGRFSLNPGGLGVGLYRGDNWSVKAVVGRDFSGDKDRGDSKTLSDMTDLDTVWAAGLEMEYETDYGVWEALIGSDVSGGHDGSGLELGYKYPIETGNWKLSPFIGAQWLSKDIVNYYYGVSAADATQNRAQYSASDAINYAIGLEAEYQIALKHSLRMEVELETLSGEIADSPIVDASSITSYRIGYAYRF